MTFGQMIKEFKISNQNSVDAKIKVVFLFTESKQSNRLFWIGQSIIFEIVFLIFNFNFYFWLVKEKTSLMINVVLKYKLK